MAVLDFPASPTLGQNFTAQNGYVYQYDGTVWTLPASSGLIVGGDLQGTLPNPTIKDRVVEGLCMTKPVFGRVIRTSNIAVTPIASWFPVPWQQMYGSYSVSAGVTWVVGTPTRLLINEAGIYVVTASMNLSGAYTSGHYLLYQNTSIVAGMSVSVGGYFALSALAEIGAGGYFEVQLLLNAAGTIESGGFAPTMYAARIG